jgi:hypothetical protein
MSDFYGCLLSTRFRVRDREKFLAAPEVRAMKEYAEENGGFFLEENGYFFFGWYDMYPSVAIPPGDYEADAEVGLYEEEEEVRLDITRVIERHILPGDLCHIGISGNQKLLIIGGALYWVTCNGTVYLDTYIENTDVITEDDLLAQAEKFLADIRQTLKANARPEAT